jgi:uncharacterized membrane protein
VSCESPAELAALERAIGHALRWGTVASSVCLAVGLAMTLAGLGTNAGRLLTEAGLIILVATPCVRVIISFVEYLRERDWVFVAMTAIVLLSLAGSVVAAFAY